MMQHAIASIAWKRQLDRLADEYEAAWRAGAEPRIEQFLQQVAPDDRPWLLEELLLVQFELSQLASEEAGEINDCRRRFSEWPGAVDRAVQQHFHRQPLLDFQRPDASSTHSAAPLDFGDFDQLQLLARGGMGTVYRARQRRLNRDVALKLLHEGFDDNPARVERFQHEARAAASLRHPHIVAVHDFGEHGRRPYLAMDLIEGETLAERIRRGPVPPREAARILHEVALGVTYAHEHGIIHRDLKPSNILLDDQGRALVTDFGLARQYDASSQLTSTGVVVGTPSYMAPELIAGEKAVRETADVYALGATLYAALTGYPPFQASSALETLMQATQNEPVAPRAGNPAIPLDLETICLKCLEKNPQRRYAQARALADDLQAFLEGRAIAAQRAGVVERVLRWRRRHPAVATLAASLAIGLALLLVGATWAARLFQGQRNEARAARDEARLSLLQSKLNEAQSLVAVRAPGHRAAAFRLVREALDIAPAERLTEEQLVALRSIAASASLLVDVEQVRQWQPQSAIVDGWSQSFDFDSTLQRYAIRDRKGGVSLRTLADDREIARLPTEGSSQAVYLSPTGRRVAILNFLPMGERLDVWDVADLPPKKLCDFSGRFGKHIAFSPNDRHIGFHQLGIGQTVVLLDTQETRVFEQSTEYEYRPLGFDADGKRIAYGDQAQLRIGDVETGQELANISLADHMFWLAWHPAGRTIAVALVNQELQVIDLERPNQSFAWRGHFAGGVSVELWGGGDRLISNDWANRMRLWDVAGRQELLTLVSHGRIFRPAAGQDLLATSTASASRLQILKLIDPRATHVLRQIGGQPTSTSHRAVLSPVDPVACSRVVELATERFALAMYDTSTGMAKATARIFASRPVRFLDDGSLIVFGSNGLFQWPRTLSENGDAIAFGPPRQVGDPVKSSFIAASSANGAALATAYDDPTIHLVVDGDPPQVIDTGLERVRSIAVSPNGAHVAAADHRLSAADDHIKIFAVSDGRLVASLPAPCQCQLKFSHDGSLLLAVPELHEERGIIWRVGTWERVAELDAVAMACDRQGHLLGASDARGTVTLHDYATRQTLCRLHLPDEEAVFVHDFSHDGAALLIHSHRFGCERLIDLRKIRAQLAELGLDWPHPAYPPPRAQPLRVRWVLPSDRDPTQ